MVTKLALAPAARACLAQRAPTSTCEKVFDTHLLYHIPVVLHIAFILAGEFPDLDDLFQEN